MFHGLPSAHFNLCYEPKVWLSVWTSQTNIRKIMNIHKTYDSCRLIPIRLIFYSASIQISWPNKFPVISRECVQLNGLEYFCLFLHTFKECCGNGINWQPNLIYFLTMENSCFHQSTCICNYNEALTNLRQFIYSQKRRFIPFAKFHFYLFNFRYSIKMSLGCHSSLNWYCCHFYHTLANHIWMRQNRETEIKLKAKDEW